MAANNPEGFGVNHTKGVMIADLWVKTKCVLHSEGRNSSLYGLVQFKNLVQPTKFDHILHFSRNVDKFNRYIFA